MVQEIVSRLVEELPAGEVVISTRLDNDDMLTPTYVEGVQALAREEVDRPRLVDAPGFRVDTRYGKVYHDSFYVPRKIPSPFISLIERKVGKRCRLASAYYDQRSVMKHHVPLQVLERPGWVQIIHGSNKTMSRPEP